MTTDLRRFPVLFLAAGREMLEAPRRWAARHRIVVLVWIAAVLVVYEARWPIQTFVSTPRWGAEGLVAALVDVGGSGYSMVCLGCASYAAGRIAGRPELCRFAMTLAVGGLWCWLLTTAGQWVLAEQRPSEGGAMRFFTRGGHGVSGHASAAALLCSPVLELLAGLRGPRPRTVRAALLGWELIVGWSRVWLGRHFLWNVVLGLAIGSITGACGARVVARASPCRHGRGRVGIR